MSLKKQLSKLKTRAKRKARLEDKRDEKEKLKKEIESYKSYLNGSGKRPKF